MQSNGYQREITMLEQVHVALNSASKLEDFYIILASMLVDPLMFGFSRAFFLRYDERARTFVGQLALGPSTADEHRTYRREHMAETRHLQEQVARAKSETPDPRAVQELYDLRFHSVWIRLIQGEEGTGLNAGFRDIALRRDMLPPNHIAEMAASSHQAQILSENSVDVTELEDFVHLPAVAGGLVTKRGLNCVVVADRLFTDKPIDEEALYHFQWLMNHASVSLDNVELVEELRIATRRMQEVDRLKTSFLSIVSHELRTPLTSIVGFVHLLMEEKLGSLSPTQKDLLRRVGMHSGHLQNMVNDLLEIAEVEAGGMVNVHLGPVDPLAALLNTIPKIEARRGKKDVSIEPVIAGQIPLIHCDENALERIYYHLLDNAVKFVHGPGKVTVEFEVNNAALDIAVADTGIGIGQEEVKRIFDYFYQVDFRLERAFGGMGMGLTVVKMLLDATRGRIHVESRPGSGSRFTLSYPVALATEDLAAEI